MLFFKESLDLSLEMVFSEFDQFKIGRILPRPQGGWNPNPSASRSAQLMVITPVWGLR